MSLEEQRCKPCEGFMKPLKGKEIEKYNSQIKGWSIIKEHHLNKEFKFKNFLSALEFVNKVGTTAEQENHHPNICFTWGKVEITIFTHAINGLSQNDFILAAKIDAL